MAFAAIQIARLQIKGHADVGQERERVILAPQEVELSVEAVRDNLHRVCVRSLRHIDNVLNDFLPEEHLQFVHSSGAAVVGEGHFVAQQRKRFNGLVQVILLLFRTRDAGRSVAPVVRIVVCSVIDRSPEKVGRALVGSPSVKAPSDRKSVV